LSLQTAVPDPAPQRLSTSLRSRSLRATLATASAISPTLGVAECSDATADDVLGVPVWFSVRTGRDGRHVHSGKGMRPEEARTGALMEAIECAAAERADLATTAERLSVDELLAPFAGALTAADLAPRFGAALPGERVLPVDRCVDFTSGREYLMPSELLRLVAPVPDADGPLFGCTSNGLASGNSLDEATLHALLEVLERDSLALDHARPSTVFVDTTTLPPPFADWSARWATLGVRLRLRVLANDFGLCCLEAELTAGGTGQPSRSTGYGMHPEAPIALARAVTEAAQCRLHALRFGQPAARVMALPPRPATGAVQQLRFDDLPTQTCDSIDAALHGLVARLRSRGLAWVLRRPLNTHPDAAELSGLHVVKVLVPGCETAVGAQVRIGRRLARRLVQAG
jgi:ribosomal protein S12 methylthiotransferase accessory factor